MVLPFLDTLGRYELARPTWNSTRADPSAHRMEEPSALTTSATLGLLALAAGDRATALAHLHRRLAHAQTWASNVEHATALQPTPRFGSGAQVDLARLLA